MTPTSETLSAQAAQLAPEERIQLVERILNSLSSPARSDQHLRVARPASVFTEPGYP